MGNINIIRDISSETEELLFILTQNQDDLLFEVMVTFGLWGFDAHWVMKLVPVICV